VCKKNSEYEILRVPGVRSFLITSRASPPEVLPMSLAGRPVSESLLRWRPAPRGARMAGAMLALALGGSLVAAPPAFAQLAAGTPMDNFTLANDYATGITAPTDIAFTPDGRAIITLKRGDVIVRQANGTLVRNTGVFMVDTASEKGLL